MRSERIFELKIHIYLNKKIDKELIDKVINLKEKRGLNKAIIKLLKEYEEYENQLELFEKKSSLRLLFFIIVETISRISESKFCK